MKIQGKGRFSTPAGTVHPLCLGAETRYNCYMKTNLSHNLIDWLNANGLDPLGDYDVRVSADERFPNLFNLKYGVISADKFNPIVCACRGAVVEKTDSGFHLVAYAFDRFFNLGEQGAAEIDWSSAKVQEKYDGSLIKLFWSGTQWVVSTSGSVGGAGLVGKSDVSFEELFWVAFDYMHYSTLDLNTDYCYVFELCSPENRVVVKYEEPQLRLLAVRDRTDDFNELDLKWFSHSWSVAEGFLLSDPESIRAAANARGADHEGFIVCDASGNRVKVKSDVYVQLHRVRGNGEPNFSELFLNGDLDEFLLHFPEYRVQFSQLCDRLYMKGLAVNNNVKYHAHLNQKDFAATVLEYYKNVSGAMFGIRSGKYANFSEYVSQMSPKQLDALLGL